MLLAKPLFKNIDFFGQYGLFISQQLLNLRSNITFEIVWVKLGFVLGGFVLQININKTHNNKQPKMTPENDQRNSRKCLG